MRIKIVRVFEHPNRCFIEFLDGKFQGRIGDYYIANSPIPLKDGMIFCIVWDNEALEPTIAHCCGKLIL